MKTRGVLLLTCLTVAVASCGRPEKPKLTPVARNGKFGYKDASGEMVIEPRFDQACGFSEGLARVNIGSVYDPGTWSHVGGLWGYIDETGKTVIEPQFDRATDFSGGVAKVRLNGRIAQIDKTGAIVEEVGKN